MKLFLCAVLLPGLCLAAILPDDIGPYHRVATSQPALTNKAIWDESGLKNSEMATYEGAKSKFTATAYQLQDTTGALAAFDWQRPANSTPSSLAMLAAETRDTLVLVHGNYLFVFTGYKPSQPGAGWRGGEPLRSRWMRPRCPLCPRICRDGALSNSERYILGPASLQMFVPGIPPSVAAFHLSAEAQYGVFHNAKGDTAITIFNYPNAQIAIKQIKEFEKLPGAIAKRSGPF